MVRQPKVATVVPEDFFVDDLSSDLWPDHDCRASRG
jgi:hypothetical protein